MMVNKNTLLPVFSINVKPLILSRNGVQSF